MSLITPTLLLYSLLSFSPSFSLFFYFSIPTLHFFLPPSSPLQGDEGSSAARLEESRKHAEAALALRPGYAKAHHVRLIREGL